MSLAGRIDIDGSRCRVRRATQTVGATGTTRTWADTARKVKLLLEEITAEKAQRLWGLESQATIRATGKASADLKKLDGLIVETGKFKGMHCQVVEDPRGSQLGTQLVIFGLLQTKETFGV